MFLFDCTSMALACVELICARLYRKSHAGIFGICLGTSARIPTSFVGIGTKHSQTNAACNLFVLVFVLPCLFEQIPCIFL